MTRFFAVRSIPPPDSTAKPPDFDPETADFARKSGARMRHMCSIKGFSSIPTVLDFPANFRISGGRDASDFRPQNRLDSGAKAPILGAKVTQICAVWRIGRSS
jgi:hypothetical protein